MNPSSEPSAGTACEGGRGPERRERGRRRSRRQPLVRYLVRPSFQCGRAFLRDLSPVGLALLVSRPLEVGDVLFVQLRGRRPGDTHAQLARVVHVTPQGPSRWLVGCELTCPLTDEQVRQTLWEG